MSILMNLLSDLLLIPLGAVHRAQLNWHWVLRTLWWLLLFPLACLCWLGNLNRFG